MDMSYRLAAFAAAAILLVAAPQSRSQETLYPNFYDNGKPSFLHGQGAHSCGFFVEHKQPHMLQDSAYYQDIAWALGYLHAIDAWNPYSVKDYDRDGLSLWLENYCRQHPLELLANAALDFYVSIGGRAPLTRDVTIWQHIPKRNPHYSNPM
jgi:hypothetical protein